MTTTNPDHGPAGIGQSFGLVVRPVRFTDDVPAMRRFLETIGLVPRIEAEAGGWVDMVSGGGMVALHSAASSNTGGQPGQTTLSFEADDVDALASALSAAGCPGVSVHDESYARVLEVTDPLGDPVVVDERSDDLYGYRTHDGSPREGLRVVPVRFTDGARDYARFLRALGLTGEPDESYALFAASGGAHGYVGVHHVYDEVLPIVVGNGASSHLTFTTPEDMDDVAARLRAAGYEDARVTREDFGDFVTVTDPDGQTVQVHEAPRG